MDEGCTFRVEFYEECARDVLRFRNANRTVSRTAEYMDWRYAARPCAVHAMVVWALDERHQAVGSAGLVPHDFWVDDKPCVVGVIGDISVEPKHQGKGLARRMLSHLASDKRVRQMFATMVLPNAGASGPLLAAGWRQVASEVRRVRLFAPGSQRIPGLTAAFEPVSRLAEYVLRHPWTRRRLPRGWSWAVGPPTCFDRRFDELWKLLPKAGHVLSERSAKYLTWRFAMHPTDEFDVLELYHLGELRGYAVIGRFADVASTVDFLCVGSHGGVALASALVEWCARQRELKSVQVRFTEPTWMNAAWNLRNGFVKRRDQVPVLWRENLTSDHLPRIHEMRDWFLTWGDKDI